MLPHLQRLNVLLAELKRRQVFRAAAFYAVAAWAVIEVTSTVLPVLLLPDWVVRVVVGIMVLGFPVVLVFAWAFDLTVEGVRRTEDNREAPPAALQFVRSLRFRATLALLVAALTGAAGWLSWRLWLHPGVADGSGVPPGGAGRGAAALDPTRLAVLYFDDFSAGDELGYLADGLTEALIHELSQISALQVVSRNGVKPFRELAIPVDSLARLLGVGSLVEGSVTRAGERIQVTVQLVEGERGMHLLSRRIEGSGSDLLTLREAIVHEAVRAIGQGLGRELQRREAQAGTRSSRAWELFQRARQASEDAHTVRWSLGDTAAAARLLLRADSLFGAAAALDPGWPEPLVSRGWVIRARAGLLSASQSTRNRELLLEGVGLADRALQRHPEDSGALALRGALRVDLFRRSLGAEEGGSLARAAERDLRAATGGDPGQVMAWVALADLLRMRGEFQEASVAARRALEADPFLINAEREVLFTLSQVWMELGDISRASRWLDEGRHRFPAEPSFPAARLVALAGWSGAPGAVDTAYALMEEVRGAFGIPDWPLGRLQVAAVLAQHGMVESALAEVATARGSPRVSPWNDYYEANVRLQLGQEEEALELLDRFLKAFPQRRPYIARDWWWEPLRRHPRFQALVAGEGA